MVIRGFNFDITCISCYFFRHEYLRTFLAVISRKTNKENATYFFFGPLLLFSEVWTTLAAVSWASTFRGLVLIALAGEEPFLNNVFFTEEERTNRIPSSEDVDAFDDSESFADDDEEAVLPFDEIWLLRNFRRVSSSISSV